MLREYLWGTSSFWTPGRVEGGGGWDRFWIIKQELEPGVFSAPVDRYHAAFCAWDASSPCIVSPSHAEMGSEVWVFCGELYHGSSILAGGAPLPPPPSLWWVLRNFGGCWEGSLWTPPPHWPCVLWWAESPVTDAWCHLCSLLLPPQPQAKRPDVLVSDITCWATTGREGPWWSWAH
jgi:hypothetical protein